MNKLEPMLIDIQAMKDYLNLEYNCKTMRTPIDKQNYLNTMENVFKILKQFEIKNEN